MAHLHAGSVALLLLAVAGPDPAPAQAPRGVEVGLGGLVLAQDPAWLGGALHVALRPGGGTRLSLGAGLGGVDGRTVGRGELLAAWLLTPRRRSGVGPYAFGGVAGVTGSGRQGYLVLGLGLEAAPGGSSGWFLEGGVGGGARFAAGWRWRRFTSPAVR